MGMVHVQRDVVDSEDLEEASDAEPLAAEREQRVGHSLIARRISQVPDHLPLLRRERAYRLPALAG
jgi:hypothetical protein